MSSLLDSPNEGHERNEKKTGTGRQGERGQKDRRQEDNVTFVPFRNPRLSEIPNCSFRKNLLVCYISNIFKSRIV